MSHRHTSQIWTRQVTGSQRLVLLVLADHANDDGIAWPSTPGCEAAAPGTPRRAAHADPGHPDVPAPRTRSCPGSPRPRTSTRRDPRDTGRRVLASSSSSFGRCSHHSSFPNHPDDALSADQDGRRAVLRVPQSQPVRRPKVRVQGL